MSALYADGSTNQNEKTVMISFGLRLLNFPGHKF